MARKMSTRVARQVAGEAPDEIGRYQRRPPHDRRPLPLWNIQRGVCRQARAQVQSEDEEGRKVITHILLFRNGNIACCDEKGKQVPEWQCPLLLDRLRNMLAAGVITRDTSLAADGREQTVGDWLARRKRRKPN